MKRLHFFKWVPLIGGIPMFFSNWEKQDRYVRAQPVEWFYYHVSCAAVALLLDVIVATVTVLHLLKK